MSRTIREDDMDVAELRSKVLPSNMDEARGLVENALHELRELEEGYEEGTSPEITRALELVIDVLDEALDVDPEEFKQSKSELLQERFAKMGIEANVVTMHKDTTPEQFMSQGSLLDALRNGAVVILNEADTRDEEETEDDPQDRPSMEESAERLAELIKQNINEKSGSVWLDMNKVTEELDVAPLYVNFLLRRPRFKAALLKLGFQAFFRGACVWAHKVNRPTP